VLEVEALALVAAAVLCALLGFSVDQRGQAHALQQVRQQHPVQATLVTPPYPAGVGGDVAKVSWTASSGTPAQTTLSVSSSDQVGDHIQVWLDTHGKSVAAPATTADSVATGVLTGILALLGAGMVIVSAAGFARSRLDRRDEAAWDAEWQIYEPLWTRS
jgi:hypothetical protein